MKSPTLLFLIVFLGGLILFFGFWLRTLLREAPARARGRVCARRETRVTRTDALLAAALTLVYGAVAFIGLGDVKGPVSRYEFPEYGSSVTIELPDDFRLSYMRWFAGVRTGHIYVWISEDGESYTNAGSFDQDYVAVLKWHDWEPDALGPRVKKIQLLSDGKIDLAELAIHDALGNRMAPEALRFEPEAAALFDEQALVPKGESTYMQNSYFDEIYHPRTAYEHIHNIKPYEVTHPPLGKLLLGIGIRIFGMTPFGWRFSGALFGALMLPVFYVLTKKLFGNSLIAFAGTTIFAFDFMHFTQTRLATIDTYAVFFILLMYLFFWLFLLEDPDAPDFSRARQTRNLFFSGLFFGMGAASKWTCLYAGAGLALLWLLHWIGRGRRLAKAERRGELTQELTTNIALCLVFFVAIPAAIYYVCYIPYGRASGLSGLKMLFSGDYARIVRDNQVYMFKYHAGVKATHPYSSRWYQWIADIRPILYYQEFPSQTTKSAIAAFLSPLVCWGGLLALPCVGWLGVRRKDKAALFLLVGYLAQLVPWLGVKRIIFEYHYFPCLPFLVLAICCVLDALRGIDRRWPRRALCFAGAAVVLFALFYPALSGVETSSFYFYRLLKWLPSWPI